MEEYEYVERGCFITFEGIDGSGKTTQSKLLSEKLNSCGQKTIWTREPGGTKLGENIRKILVDSGDRYDPIIDSLLFCAARRHHFNSVIEPSLLSQTNVVCDRYFDSTLVYQHYCKGMDKDSLYTVFSIAEHVYPDITFLIDLPVEIAMERISNRGSFDSFDDQADLNFKRSSYLKLTENTDESRFIVIDGSRSAEDVAENIYRAYLDFTRTFLT